MSDIYLQLLRYADSKGIDGFTEPEVIAEFGKEIKPILDNANKSGAFTYRERDNQSFRILAFEGKFKLLDHLEMIEARRASRTATWLSRAAIIISVLFGVSSLMLTAYYSDKQLTTPVRLSEDQFEKIVQANIQAAKISEQSFRICDLPIKAPPCL